jgi:hypothetical protein
MFSSHFSARNLFAFFLLSKKIEGKKMKDGAFLVSSGDASRYAIPKIDNPVRQR